MPRRLRTTAIWLGLVVAFLLLFQLTRREAPIATLPFETFAEYLDQEAISEVRVEGNAVDVELYGGARFRVLGVLEPAQLGKLSAQGVIVNEGPAPKGLSGVIPWLLGVVLALAALLYFVRKAGAGQAGMLALRRSRHRLVSAPTGVRFADVGGCEEAKLQLADVVDFLANPERWQAAGVRIPRGVLLEGPPGCGKTLLARALAGETKARFLSISASEFVEMFVGVGAARVRDLFEAAAKQAPAVVFIDELDAIGRRRGSGVGFANDEREHTLNQLLVNLDGFERHARVVVIAATNRADILDAALLRPGRFDRRIVIPPLARAERLCVLEIHARGKPLAVDVSLAALAELSDGATGADLEGLVNEAGLLAVRRARADGAGQLEIRQADFVRALHPAAGGFARRFDQVDALLIESSTRLTQPTGRALVRLTLVEGAVVEGELIWADAVFVKLRSENGGGARIVPKLQIKSIEPLAGTDWAHAELQPNGPR